MQLPSSFTASMMRELPRVSSFLGETDDREHSAAEMKNSCGGIFRVFSVTTMASDHDGRSDSGFEASEFEADPITGMDRQSSNSTETALSSKGFGSCAGSVTTMASDHAGRSDSGFESEMDRQNSDGAEAPLSKGSMNHPHGCGAPCKYAAKANGCKDGANCTHCHLCKWDRSVMRSRTSALMCAPCTTDLVKTRQAVGTSKTTKAQEKRLRQRARRRLSATEGDYTGIGSGYMSPGEEFWY